MKVHTQEDCNQSSTNCWG